MASMFHLTIPDWLKGIIMAFIGGGLTTLYTALTGDGNINWKTVAIAAGAAGIAYIIKNFFSDSTGAVLGIPSTAAQPPSDTPKN